MLVLPSKIYPVWENFLIDNKILVYKYIVREIKKGMAQKAPLVKLFEFDDGSMRAWIPSEEYVNFLKNAKDVFVESEEYEYAGKVCKMLDLHYINKLIEESIPKEG